MTRGNQREVARNKNQKKQQEQSKKKPSGGDGLRLDQRKHRDAELMREKQKKKEDAATSGSKSN
ncbi:hypothetical protein PPYR_05833 [Photinus pyralis]|uniref:Small EDRK-rich factor-like N-terminal domain-containing protein n=1 Tax=Photinus pyralis TaxID=7054 RepID=A0A5N4AVW7_PHOPY|nr:hypothetical protein PPYR_05833 [Photinus pyralis]